MYEITKIEKRVISECDICYETELLINNNKNDDRVSFSIVDTNNGKTVFSQDGNGILMSSEFAKMLVEYLRESGYTACEYEHNMT